MSSMTSFQWNSTAPEPVLVDGEHGPLHARLVRAGGQELLVVTSIEAVEIPLVRFHSACVFGEAFRAVDCDCGAQLEAFLKLIADVGGVATYGWEEGRGVGIVNKIRAMALQQAKNIDTAEAFRQLGHDPEPRDFKNHIAALRSVFDGNRIRVASSNPKKLEVLAKAGFEVVERVKLDIPMTEGRKRYLEEKRAALGHLE